MYEIEVRHEGLHKYRLIKGNDLYVVEQKAEAQMAAWNEIWERKQQAEQQRQERASRAQEKEAKKALAAERTAQAQAALAEIEGILSHTLAINDTVQWESLEDRSKFAKPKPRQPDRPVFPPKPDATDAKYQPHLTLLDRLMSSRRERKAKLAADLYRYDCMQWENQKRTLEQQYETGKAKYAAALERWESEREEFVQLQQARNKGVDDIREAYLGRDPNAIIEYCDLVLGNSEYPDGFPQEFDLDYNPETHLLVVDYSLPSTAQIPKVKEVKYVQSRDEFVEAKLTESEETRIYDRLLYEITLRTIHELFEADAIGALLSIVFNGWVRSVDRATGNEVNACILSVQVNRDEFMAINLAQVDPKGCFKKLKGIGSAKLHSLSPVAPLLELRKEDKRFVSSYDVADKLDEGYNLAAMDWEDFEHLVRELFEKEFSHDGGEVKITRASRDGGVDAVAFDPDPIRGGKIVIQANAIPAQSGYPPYVTCMEL